MNLQGIESQRCPWQRKIHRKGKGGTTGTGPSRAVTLQPITGSYPIRGSRHSKKLNWGCFWLIATEAAQCACSWGECKLQLQERTACTCNFRTEGQGRNAPLFFSNFWSDRVASGLQFSQQTAALLSIFLRSVLPHNIGTYCALKDSGADP
jgi:hypothetical protein